MFACNRSHAKYIHNHVCLPFDRSFTRFFPAHRFVRRYEKNPVKMLNFIIDSILFFICKYVWMWIHYQKCFESIGLSNVGSIKRMNGLILFFDSMLSDLVLCFILLCSLALKKLRNKFYFISSIFMHIYRTSTPFYLLFS